LHPESERVGLLLLLLLLLKLRTERLLLLRPARGAEPKRVGLRLLLLLLLLLRGRVHESALRSVFAAAPSRTSVTITR
jgi:hypothetical protein